MRLIVVAGPCAGRVFETGNNFAERFMRVAMLDCKEGVIDYLGDMEPRRASLLYIHHQLVASDGKTAYYAPAEMSLFDVLTKLLNQ